MPGQGRLGDVAQVPADAHGCPACPHTAVGPAIAGSPNVFVNSRPAVRVGDMGIHAACCGPNMWTAQQGSASVFINGKPAHRIGDANMHCGGIGKLTQGSENVIVGDSSSGGGGGGSGGTVKGGDTAGGAGGAPEESTFSHEDEEESTEEAKAEWQLQYSDGTPVRGFTAHYLPPSGGNSQEMIPDAGGSSRVSGLKKGHLFDVTLVGNVTARGQLKDHEGKPLANSDLLFTRAFGPSLRLRTDGGGAFEAKGLLQDEPFDVTVNRARAAAEGRFQFEDGSPKPGVTGVVQLADGQELHIKSDDDGRIQVFHELLDEGYRLRVDDIPGAAEGTLQDEEGRPIAGATAVVIVPDGYGVPVRTDGAGHFKVEHPRIDEGYGLRVVRATATAEGVFQDEEGRPLPGVRAELHLASGGTVQVQSDDEGRFEAEGLMPGETYSLRVLGAPVTAAPGDQGAE